MLDADRIDHHGVSANGTNDLLSKLFVVKTGNAAGQPQHVVAPFDLQFAQFVEWAADKRRLSPRLEFLDGNRGHGMISFRMFVFLHGPRPRAADNKAGPKNQEAEASLDGVQPACSAVPQSGRQRPPILSHKTDCVNTAGAELWRISWGRHCCLPVAAFQVG